LKFLLDVHVSTSVARTLQDAGHDVVRAALDYPTWPDADLLALAARKAMVIVTQDSDFTDLVFAHGQTAPEALVFIRCEPDEQPHIARQLLVRLDLEKLKGHVGVVMTDHTRYRAFPKKDELDD
jgi:predicted nuclease of predicted toxin-antitoxin system